jgi:hypothetical protein
MKKKIPLPEKIGRIVAGNVVTDLRGSQLPYAGTEREWKTAPNLAAFRALMAYRLRSARKRRPEDEARCAHAAYDECEKLLRTTPGLGLSKATFEPFRPDVLHRYFRT